MQGFARGIPISSDGTLATNSDGLVPSEKAIKTYVDSIPKPTNILINGGFDFAQRTAPGTLTTVAADGYGPDRWRMTRETANFQYKRFDATGETGLVSKYYGQFFSDNGGKSLVCQIIEGVNTVPLRGMVVTFQAMLKASASRTWKMAILELQNAGTMDTIPGTLVSSWNADGSDPTFGSNVVTITASQSKSVTTSWVLFSVSVTVPSNSKNLIAALWTNSDPLGANEYINIAEAGLYRAPTTQPWLPRLTSEEFSLCQRYYEKTFDVDTAPAYGYGYYYGETLFQQVVAGAVGFYTWVPFATRKRIDPTIAFFNPPNSGVQAANYNGGGDCSSTAVLGTARESGFGLTATGVVGSAAGNLNGVHWTASAEL